jgi:hypothetical protein
MVPCGFIVTICAPVPRPFPDPLVLDVDVVEFMVLCTVKTLPLSVTI